MEGAVSLAQLFLSVLFLLQLGQLHADGCRAPVIEILVSPLVGKRYIRLMNLSWDVGQNWKQGDWVGLYNRPPSMEVAPVFSTGVNNSVGDIRTGIQEGRQMGDPVFTKKCLGWWTAYWHQNDPNPVAQSCLSTNPRWMEEMKSELGKMKLNNILIPGTHDSGSFLLAYKGFHDNRINRYIFTQDETIMEQLIHGARLLDLRIAVNDGKFWVNHGIASVHPLEYILHDVKQFVEKTNEIVILDFHEFPQGFEKSETHHKLIDFIKSTLGEHMAPPYLGWATTLNDLWLNNKRIIVAYNEKNIVKERMRDVWWPVSQKWGNKRTVKDLYAYLKDITNKAPSYGGIMWSAMAELTPNAWDVITDRLKGLRAMADDTNKYVTAWFRGEWGSSANGVSVDFLRSTGIVDAAIRWNRRRASGTMCD